MQKNTTKKKENKISPGRKPIKNKEENQERTYTSTFIFDENKILKPAVFTQTKISEEELGLGLLLPKEVELTDKKGLVVGQDQVWKPVMITSKNKLIEINKANELKYKLKFNPVPSNLTLRWSLSSIKKYLNSKEPKIDGKKLYDKIKTNSYQKFCFYREPLWYDTHVLWDMGTYFHQLFNNYALLENRGLPGTAKTKNMVLSSYITLNSTDILINPSEPSLFRETYEKRPTKYIDEAEKLFRFNPKTKTIEPDLRVELINASYYKKGCVPRVEKFGNKFVTIYYHVYSPTQISSVNGLYGATETRAITHIMTKAPDKDTRGEMEPEDYAEEPIWQEIRDELYLFTLQNWKEVEEGYKTFTIKTKLRKRDLQLWKPLLVLAKLIDKKLLNDILAFAEKLSEQRKADFIPEGCFDYKILTILKDLISEDTKVYVDYIKKRYKENHPNDDIRPGFNKTISAKLDNLGFKELRSHDKVGSYFEITPDTFEIIISPICPDLSPQSPQSPQIDIDIDKDIEIGDESVVNGGEKKGGECGESGILSQNQVNPGKEGIIQGFRGEGDEYSVCEGENERIQKITNFLLEPNNRKLKDQKALAQICANHLGCSISNVQKIQRELGIIPTEQEGL